MTASLPIALGVESTYPFGSVRILGRCLPRGEGQGADKAGRACQRRMSRTGEAACRYPVFEVRPQRDTQECAALTKTGPSQTELQGGILLPSAHFHCALQSVKCHLCNLFSSSYKLHGRYLPRDNVSVPPSHYTSNSTGVLFEHSRPRALPTLNRSVPRLRSSVKGYTHLSSIDADPKASRLRLQSNIPTKKIADSARLSFC